MTSSPGPVHTTFSIGPLRCAQQEIHCFLLGISRTQTLKWTRALVLSFYPRLLYFPHPRCNFWKSKTHIPIFFVGSLLLSWQGWWQRAGHIDTSVTVDESTRKAVPGDLGTAVVKSLLRLENQVWVTCWGCNVNSPSPAAEKIPGGKLGCVSPDLWPWVRGGGWGGAVWGAVL